MHKDSQIPPIGLVSINDAMSNLCTSADVLFYAGLCLFAREEKESGIRKCWPSMSTLQRVTSLSHGQLYRSKRRLIEAKAVNVYHDNKGGSDVYNLDLLPEDGYATVHTSVITDYRLSVSDKVTYLGLCLFTNTETGECYPGITDIIKAVPVSERQVRYSLKTLENKRVLRVKRVNGINSHYLLKPFVDDSYRPTPAMSGGVDTPQVGIHVGIHVGTPAVNGGTPAVNGGVPRQSVEGTPAVSGDKHTKNIPNEQTKEQTGDFLRKRILNDNEGREFFKTLTKQLKTTQKELAERFNQFAKTLTPESLDKDDVKRKFYKWVWQYPTHAEKVEISDYANTNNEIL